MEWLEIIGRLVLDFVIGTGVLWFCTSMMTDTANANLKTAAIYNGIVTALGAILLGIGFIFISTESNATGTLFVASTLIFLAVSFILLKRLYDLSIGATIWLVIGMWAIETGIEKLMKAIF